MYTLEQLNHQMLSIFRAVEPLNVAQFCYATWEKFGQKIKIHLGELNGRPLIALVDLNLVNTQKMYSHISKYGCINWDELAVAYKGILEEEDMVKVNRITSEATQRIKDRGTTRIFPGKVLSDLLPQSGFLSDKFYQIDIGNFRQVDEVPELNTGLTIERNSTAVIKDGIQVGAKIKLVL